MKSIHITQYTRKEIEELLEINENQLSRMQAVEQPDAFMIQRMAFREIAIANFKRILAHEGDIFNLTADSLVEIKVIEDGLRRV